MRKALMLAAASALVLSACEQQPKNDHPDGRASDTALNVGIVEPEPAEGRIETARDVTQPPPPKLQVRRSSRPEAVEAVAPAPREIVTRTPPPRPAPLAPVAQIAYAFSYAMSTPKDRGAELMSRHEFACVSAGAGLCQVVSANADWTSRAPGGKLELRGQPEWINRFRSGLALDARNAGGRLESATTEGENVTRDIDVAQTGAKTTATLADRIRELQRRQGGTMAQQLEIERQIDDLQRQHDAQQIELRALNDRVLSARLTIDYREGGVMAADSATRPVAHALQNAFGLSMGMLAVLITVSSVMLPIAVIGGAVWWAVIRRRRRTVAPA